MRLTKKREDGFYYDTDECMVSDCSNKLGPLEDIEDELGIDLIILFDSKYEGGYFEMELEEDDKTIYFDGDSFYGHYSSEDFLKLIKDMLSMYRQLIKLGH